MQKAWDVLRDEAADNYGFQERFQEDKARERMGPLAKPTLVVFRNRGAAERKKARRVEAFVAERSRAAEDATREEGTRFKEGEAQQQQEEADDSPKNMDALMEAVAEAISQTEREAAAAQADATGDVRETQEAEAARTREAEREADARRRASNFLQSMRNLGGGQAGEISKQDYSRRRSKEPALLASQAAYVLTPP